MMIPRLPCSGRARRSTRAWTVLGVPASLMVKAVGVSTAGKPVGLYREGHLYKAVYAPLCRVVNGLPLRIPSVPYHVRITSKDLRRRTLTGHTGTVYGVVFSPDGALLATASADGTARLWDLPGRRGEPAQAAIVSLRPVAIPGHCAAPR